MKGIIFKYQDSESTKEKSTFVKCKSWIEFGQKMRAYQGNGFKYEVNKSLAGNVVIDGVFYSCDFEII